MVLRVLATGAMIGTLAACGGSSTGGPTLDESALDQTNNQETVPVVIVEIEEENRFVLESSGEGFGGNGLVYASADTGQSLEDLAAGDSFEIRIAGYENLQGETTLTPTLTTETVTLIDDGEGGLSAQVTYRGETLTFAIVDSSVDDTTELASGQIVSVFSPAGGAFSAAYDLYTYAYSELDPAAGAPNANGFFIVGFETDPNTVAGLSGTATYDGRFGGYGGISRSFTDPDTGDVSEDVLNEIEVDGNLTLTVSFDDADVDADLTGFIDNSDEPDFTAAMRDAPITGNNFVGDLDVTCTGDLTCTSASQMGGSFYGPNGEEAVGLIAFDVDATVDDGTELKIVSGAYFGTVAD